MEEADTRVMKRLLLLEQTFKNFRKEFGTDFQHARMNRAVLCIVVKSYFDDVDRHKAYHGSELIDEVKQAGFTIKWISKLRPLQFDCDESETTNKLLYVNEIFAVRCGLAFMEVSLRSIPDQIYADILYTLHYRNIDERMLFVWLATLGVALDKKDK